MAPVLFITARDGVADKLRGLALGALDFIGKPFDEPELAARVRTALRIRSLGEDLDAANREIERLAKSDPVTGVANRRQLSEVLQQACSVADRYGRPLSMVIGDIDHLRLINDGFGLDAGDRALARLARVMEAASRDADTVGRFGGSEFIVICPETEVGGAAVLAGRIRAGTEASVGAVVGDVTITASFGCAEKAPSESAEELLRRCSQALDTAKRGGRNRVCLARSGDEAQPAPSD